MTEADLIRETQRYFNLHPDENPEPWQVEGVWLRACPVRAVSDRWTQRLISRTSHKAPGQQP